MKQFWSDDFDADLLQVVPRTCGIVGGLADITLYTHGGTWNGRLNLPATWTDGDRSVAFFGTCAESFKPEHFYTRHPVVQCTFLELLRDVWVHRYDAIVDGVRVWTAPRENEPDREFEALMYHLRSWARLPPQKHHAIVRRVERKLRRSARTLAGLAPWRQAAHRTRGEMR